jgi:hypothetical protein
VGLQICALNHSIRDSPSTVLEFQKRPSSDRAWQVSGTVALEGSVAYCAQQVRACALLPDFDVRAHARTCWRGRRGSRRRPSETTSSSAGRSSTAGTWTRCVPQPHQTCDGLS